MEQDQVCLFEEYRLIERSENEINGAWKGVHLLLFFLAFIFGSFCTFCFHMLMYLFDEKCVLFPKLLSLTSSRHNVIYEFMPEEKGGEATPSLPVDFLSTQWVEKSACYLPTFVPLVSGIFGLVWTTMFLMCSSGSRTLTGLQRPWRVLPPVLIFSLAMGSLCVYSSSVTHYGLQQLCVKLGEITGSSTCTYTVNVATLAYERRIRGVYQATWLTIISAWLHTLCWLLSAVVALLRILLAVDFQLVRISVDLIGDVDRLLERREEQIRIVSPTGPSSSSDDSSSSTELGAIYRNKSVELDTMGSQTLLSSLDSSNAIYVDTDPTLHRSVLSELSLVPEERDKLARLKAYQHVQKNRYFIVKMIYDLLDQIELPATTSDFDLRLEVSSAINLINKQSRLEGIEGVATTSRGTNTAGKRDVQKKSPQLTADSAKSQMRGINFRDSSIDIGAAIENELKTSLEEALTDYDNAAPKKKSNLKSQASVRTHHKKKLKVTISQSVKEPQTETSTSSTTSEPDIKNIDKDTQTKEKQD